MLTNFSLLSILNLVNKSPNLLKPILALIVLVLIIFGFVYFYTGPGIEKIIPTQLTANNSLKEKAKSAGWKIAWVGDKNDTSGRTILAEGQRSEELLPDNFYWTLENNKELKLTGLAQGMGVFEKWEKIPNSKDYYMILKNPHSKLVATNKLTARIIIDDIKISTKTAVVRPTVLAVENLDYGFKNKTVAFAKDYARFADISDNVLNKIIKPGDVVVIYPIFLNQEQMKAQKQLNLIDEKKIPYALTVFVRRFGGKETTLSELNK